VIAEEFGAIGLGRAAIAAKAGGNPVLQLALLAVVAQLAPARRCLVTAEMRGQQLAGLNGLTWIAAQWGFV
jgi:hypothetical protein